MDVDFLKSIRKVTERNLDDLSKKTELSAAETKAAKDAMELIDYIDCKIDECEMKDTGYSQRAPYREYRISSYSHPRMYNHMKPVYYGDPYASGYSGHSITDRAVSLMEGMMDGAKSDYERSQIMKFIEMIRAAA